MKSATLSVFAALCAGVLAAPANEEVLEKRLFGLTATTTTSTTATPTATPTPIWTGLASIVSTSDLLTTSQLSSYSVSSCQALCAANSKCVFFDIYSQTPFLNIFATASSQCALYSQQHAWYDATDTGSVLGYTYSNSGGYVMPGVAVTVATGTTAAKPVTATSTTAAAVVTTSSAAAVVTSSAAAVVAAVTSSSKAATTSSSTTAAVAALTTSSSAAAVVVTSSTVAAVVTPSAVGLVIGTVIAATSATAPAVAITSSSTTAAAAATTSSVVAVVTSALTSILGTTSSTTAAAVVATTSSTAAALTTTPAVGIAIGTVVTGTTSSAAAAVVAVTSQTTQVPAATSVAAAAAAGTTTATTKATTSTTAAAVAATTSASTTCTLPNFAYSGWCKVSTAIVQKITAAAANPSSLNTGIIIPLYIYPSWWTTPGAWDWVVTAAQQYPSMPFVVVVNPSSGPGTSATPNSDYVHEIARLGALSNVQLLGYVDTAYGSRALNDVLNDVSVYAGWGNANSAIAIDGIFFDNAASTATYLGQYTSYASAVRANSGFAGARLVALAPGSVCNPSYVDIADIVVVFEQGSSIVQSNLFGWYQSFYSGMTAAQMSKISWLVNAADQTTQQVVQNLQAAFNTPYLYVTDMSGWQTFVTPPSTTVFSKVLQMLANPLYQADTALVTKS